jgi:hypothetical protein
MKNITLIFVLVVALSSCFPTRGSKEKEVEATIWILVDKELASRFVDGRWVEYVWLIWRTKDNDLKREKVLAQIADGYLIGTRVVNRDSR